MCFIVSLLVSLMVSLLVSLMLRDLPVSPLVSPLVSLILRSLIASLHVSLMSQTTFTMLHLLISFPQSEPFNIRAASVSTIFVTALSIKPEVKPS